MAVRPLELVILVAAAVIAVEVALPRPQGPLSLALAPPEIAAPSLPGSLATSPDGLRFAIVTGDRLEIRAVAGDSVRVLVHDRALSGSAVAWARDDLVLFTWGGSLYAIDLQSGVARQLAADLPDRVVAIRPEAGGIVLRAADGSVWRLDGLAFGPAPSVAPASAPAPSVAPASAPAPSVAPASAPAR